MARFKKEDVQYHSDGYGRGRKPAVNVKVYDSLAKGFAEWKTDNPDTDVLFTVEWIEANLSDEQRSDYFYLACENGYECAQDDAREIWGRLWGKDINVYSQGRSGGWAVVDAFGEEDVESWNAIELAKWAKWARGARRTADYVMASTVDLIYWNVFLDWRDEQYERDGAEAFAPEAMRAALGG